MGSQETGMHLIFGCISFRGFSIGISGPHSESLREMHPLFFAANRNEGAGGVDLERRVFLCGHKTTVRSKFERAEWGILPIHPLARGLLKIGAEALKVIRRAKKV